MALLFVTALILLLPFNGFAGFFEPKVLSPSSNVHVDVVNHVAGSLMAHSQQFQHTWRDYAIIFLLVIVVGASLLGCCCVATVYIYRRILVKLLRHGTAQTADGPHGMSHPIRTPYMIT